MQHFSIPPPRATHLKKNCPIEIPPALSAFPLHQPSPDCALPAPSGSVNQSDASGVEGQQGQAGTGKTSSCHTGFKGRKMHNRVTNMSTTSHNPFWKLFCLETFDILISCLNGHSPTLSYNCFCFHLAELPNHNQFILVVFYCAL